jgi:hypothetical protein
MPFLSSSVTLPYMRSPTRLHRHCTQRNSIDAVADVAKRLRGWVGGNPAELDGVGQTRITTSSGGVTELTAKTKYTFGMSWS